jgi:hypothetical protein
MKILESQNAVLTNYEVYQHLVEQRRKFSQRGKRKTPGNLATLVKEVSSPRPRRACTERLLY